MRYVALGAGKIGEAAGRKSRVGGPMICPICKLELGVERPEGEVVLTYSLKDWAGCTYRGGNPVLCPNLMPTILKLLSGRASATEAGEPRK